MPPSAAAIGVTQLARRSESVRWACLAVLTVPLLLPVLLVVLLDGGLRAQRIAACCSSGTHAAGTAPTRSAAGAQGLAQFLPATWASEGLDGNGDGRRDPFDPADAIASQASFLCRLLTAVLGDDRLVGQRLDLALAAYNAGLGTVRRAGGVPPYPETQAYVRRVRGLTAGYAAPGATGLLGTVNKLSGRWVWPAAGPISSGFGPRWGRLHAGIDLAVPVGTAVLAANAGTVVAAGPASGFGAWVKIAHPGGVSTVYGHLSSWSVTVGQPVTAGQRVALSGDAGRSSGPHLHFEVRVAGQPVDPAAFYGARPGAGS